VSNFFICDFLQLDFYKARIKPCKSQKALHIKNYLLASSIATATATVIPTIGLLPAPMSPIISLQKQLKRFKTLVNKGVRHIAPWEKLVTSSTAIITGKRSLSSGFYEIVVGVVSIFKKQNHL